MKALKSKKFVLIVVAVAIVGASSFLLFEEQKELDLSKTLIEDKKSQEAQKGDKKPFTQKEMIAYSESLEQQGKYEEAIDYLSKAIEIDPDVARAYVNRAFARTRINDWQGAINDFSIAIELDPSFAAYYGRGFALIAIREDENGVSDLNKALELDPELKLEFIEQTQCGVRWDEPTQKLVLDESYCPGMIYQKKS